MLAILIGGRVWWPGGMGQKAWLLASLPLSSCVTPGAHIHWGWCNNEDHLQAENHVIYDLASFFPSFLACLPPVVSCFFSGLRLAWSSTFQARALL